MTIRIWGSFGVVVEIWTRTRHFNTCLVSTADVTRMHRCIDQSLSRCVIMNSPRRGKTTLVVEFPSTPILEVDIPRSLRTRNIRILPCAGRGRPSMQTQAR